MFKKIIFGFTIALSFSSAMDVRELTLNLGQIERKNFSGAGLQSVFCPTRETCQNILTSYRHGEQLLDASRDEQGGFGYVCFSANYAVKISYDHDKSELSRLQKVCASLYDTSAFNVCLPKVYFKLKYSHLVLDVSVQIYSRLHPVCSLKDTASTILSNHSSKEVRVFENLGSSLGQFHSKRWSHGDFNGSNVMIDRYDANGNPVFTLIDLGDCQTNVDGPSDAIYFCYWAGQLGMGSELTDAYKYGMRQLIDHFYFGYVMALQKPNCQKLIQDVFHKGASPLDYMYTHYNYGVRNTYMKTMLDGVQIEAFNKSFSTIHPKVYDYARVLPTSVSADFNEYIYLAMNPDLLAHRNDWSTLDMRAYGRYHYTYHGKNEGRAPTYDPNNIHQFNPILYICINRDLLLSRDVWGVEEMKKQGTQHWNAHGQFEGRSWK